MVELSLKNFEKYRVTTAEILYHLPDHPSLLQAYIWQELDIPPNFPELAQFLEFWEKNLDGKMHSVRVASARLIHPDEIGYYSEGFRLQ